MVHIVPLNDTMKHKLKVDCPCEPYVEYIDPETGTPYPCGPLVKHFDRRGRAINDDDWQCYETGDYL